MYVPELIHLQNTKHDMFRYHFMQYFSNLQMFYFCCAEKGSVLGNNYHIWPDVIIKNKLFCFRFTTSYEFCSLGNCICHLPQILSRELTSTI